MKPIPHGTVNGYSNYKCRCDLCCKARREDDQQRRAECRGRPVPEDLHGTENAYSNYACRCDRCKAGNALRRKERLLAGVPEGTAHGTRSSYQTYGCRCEVCREANREYDRARIEANPELREQARQRERRWRERHPEQSAASQKATYEKRKQTNWERMKAEQKVRNDDYRLRSKGIEAHTEAELLASQNGVCAICGQKDKTKLSIDHCHTTGLIRGLLCRPCNLGLGCFKDDVERLKKAIDYLEND